ncbi:hypothetical protein E4U41_003449 [Claviceps citrina]|nr:hypothetical protein E4U41_003449 [Claviceps citrina]
MSDLGSTQSLIIILTTTIPSAAFVVLTTVLCCRARRRRARFFARAITPIDDEEIESWKLDRRASEKSCEDEYVQHQGSKMGSHGHHRPSTSVSSVQKPASVIIYHNASPCSSSPSSEDGPVMTLTMPRKDSKDSLDCPSVPVLARAPNSRPGLTDETVQGEDAFISQPKRQTVRLSKAPSSRGRSKSTQAPMSSCSPWQHGPSVNPRLLPRRSADTFIPATHLASRQGISQGISQGMCPTFTTPRWGSLDEEILLGGLSPRPLIHHSEIGRAIG